MGLADDLTVVKCFEVGLADSFVDVVCCIVGFVVVGLLMGDFGAIRTTIGTFFASLISSTGRSILSFFEFD